MNTTTELCPACLTELPADYPYDHVAIDQALAGRVLTRLGSCGHEWPPELDADATCLHCGLAYRDWSQDGVAA